ncbi:hypothetical protein [Yinghuangia sp. YIM S09857]|uniref:hypothetical protein n=1 Tax=Yinghuangia sp. YIM S09857 TaxID=3436929 RepID=UPI003F52E9CE
MRNTDPFEFFQDHRDTIFRWSAIAGIVLALFLVVRLLAMRLGGWRAAWRRLCREVALTAYAFGAPVRGWLRHRRVLRILVRHLARAATWRDAERALVDARFAAAPAQPYAVRVADDAVTVHLAGRNIPEATGIWEAVADAPGAWTAPRGALPGVVPDAEGTRPIVVALGEADGGCVFLDLAIGPPMVAVEGEKRSHNALFQAVAAQLDARLPAPQAVVAEGVHADYAGEPPRAAYRTARATPPRLGVPAFLVTAALPDPLPPELAEPPDGVPAIRILLKGPGRSYVRTLLTDKRGQVAIPGTPVVTTCHALGAALARVLPDIPPVLPPAPAADPESAAAELFEESTEAARAVVPEPVGVAAPIADLFEETSAAASTAGPPLPRHAELFEEYGEAGTAAVGTTAQDPTPRPSPAQLPEAEAEERRPATTTDNPWLSMAPRRPGPPLTPDAPPAPNSAEEQPTPEVPSPASAAAPEPEPHAGELEPTAPPPGRATPSAAFPPPPGRATPSTALPPPTGDPVDLAPPPPTGRPYADYPPPHAVPDETAEDSSPPAVSAADLAREASSGAGGGGRGGS